MKKIITILIVLFSTISCFKVEIMENNPFNYTKGFQDTCTIGDTTSYYMSCNSNINEVELYFYKKTKRTLYEYDVVINHNTYHMTKDTLITLYENYKYKPNDFIKLLEEKNKLKRDTTIFKFTPEMYCTWDTFDKMYNTYCK